MHGFIHAEMSVAKLKRLSTSGLMLMSVPKGHGLPNARRKQIYLKSWRKEGHLFVDILQVIAGQRSRVDKEAFKKYMRNMKHVYDAHKVFLTLLNQPVIVLRIKSIIIMMHQCLRNRAKMKRTRLSIQRRAQKAKKINRKWSLWMIKDDLCHIRILVFY